MRKVGIEENISKNDLDEEFGSEKLYQNNHQRKKNKPKIKRILFALNEKQRSELLEKAEFQNIKHYLMIRLLFEAALRANELANLIIENIDFKTGQIIIQSRPAAKYYGSFKTKYEDSNREQIWISQDLTKSLKDYIGERKTGYIFESRKKKGRNGKFPIMRVDSICNMINKYARQCESIPKHINNKGNITKDIGSHAPRRTTATYLLGEGYDLSEIADFLGHKSTRTTHEYLKKMKSIDPQKLRKTMNKMNKKENKKK